MAWKGLGESAHWRAQAGRKPLACLELCHMLSVSLPVGGQSPLLNGIDHPGDIGLSQYRRGFILDIANDPAVHHVVRHGGFESAVANKIDDGVKLVVRQPQQGSEGHHMQIVLAQGILKAVLTAIDLLGPAFMGRIAEYPPLHVFGLYHEYSEAGDDHMIDLGRALRGGQGHVLEQVIFPLVEKEPDTEVEQAFPHHPLEPVGLDQGGNQQQGQQIPKLGQQRGNDGSEVHFNSLVRIER